MESEESDIHPLSSNGTNALSLVDVREFLEKRKNFLKKFRKEKNFKNNKIQNFEKILEYSCRFSNFKTIKNQKVRYFINQIKENKDIQQKEFIRIEIFICKILDLDPKNYEESVNLIPGIEKFLEYKDIKFFFE
jgi:hypothetical protein